MADLHPQLAAIDAELRATTARARQLVDAVDEAAFHARPDTDRWSIAECLAHLNLTSEAYLPLIDEVVTSGRGPAPQRFRRDWMGWLLGRMAEPPVRARVKTTAPFVPRSTGSKQQVLTEYEALQEKLAAALRSADGFDLGRLRIVSPFKARFRYNLYSAFRIIPAHQRRHLRQGERVLEALGKAPHF